MVLFARNQNRLRVDRQRVYVPAHQFGGGSIDHSMPLYLRDAVERRGGNGHVEMTAFPGAGVTRVLGAVIADLEQALAQCGGVK